jgi:DNA polymerase (family 10)
MKNQEIAKIFNEIADLLEIKNDNPFRIRAYRKAAQNVESLSEDVTEIIKSGKKLTDIPGIGKDLAEKIIEYVNTGKVASHEELKAEIPRALLDLMSVPGLGPKTAKLIYDKLDIDSIDKLEEAARSHKLQQLPKIRQKTEENILKGIEFLKKSRGRIPLGLAWPVACDIVKALSKLKEVKKIDTAGSLRRCKETIGDIDILVVSDKPEKVMNAFTTLPVVSEVLAKGETKSSIRTKDNIQVDIRVVDSKCYGAALAYFTGSKAHNIRLREMAVKKGLKISEYGVFDEKTNKFIAGAEEKDIYDAVGLPWIPSELREDTGEIEAALKGELPDLIETKHIKADFHIHTKWSDGGNTIEEMVEAARRRGYSYIAITDHSRALGVAHGLDEKRILEQIEVIRKLNAKIKDIKILCGIEANIGMDGSLDLPVEILKKLDIVVASVHSGFKQDRRTMTERVIKCLKSGLVDILGHPTGRLLGERDAYEIDMGEVLKVAKETGTAIEVNAYPLRLDLTDINCKRAKEIGVKIAVSTDSHFTDQLDYMSLGVSVARRGWLERADVINTLEFGELLATIKRRRN